MAFVVNMTMCDTHHCLQMNAGSNPAKESTKQTTAKYPSA